MFNSFKIRHKMFIGAMIMVSIISAVGYFGLKTNNTMGAQNYIIGASRNMVIGITEGRDALDKYLSTDSLDKLGEIEREMVSKNNVVNKWIEILGHGSDYDLFKKVEGDEQLAKMGFRGSEDIVFNWEVAQITQDIESLRRESQGIYKELIKAHENSVVLKNSFDNDYPKEKELRYTIKDIVYNLDNIDLVKGFDEILYLSKEALYQYKDKKHADDWINSIVQFKDKSLYLEDHNLISLVDSYFDIAVKMSNNVIESEEKQLLEKNKREEYDGYLDRINEKKDEMNLVISSIISETKAKTSILLFSVIFVSIFLGIVLSLVITKSITTPIKKLSESAKKIAEGNLSHRAQIGGNDEISGFAKIFNDMTDKLQWERKNVDKKVVEQTKEIAKNQKSLQDQRRALVNILEDVDEERRGVSRERDKIKTILQGIGDGVFVVDKNFNIILFNKMAENIFGFSSKEVIGKKYYNFLKFVHEDSLIKVNDFIKETIEEGKIKEMASHTAIVRKDKKTIPVADSAAPLRDIGGNIVGCVVVFRDVTREREVDKAKTEFVSLASHQLRTPLSSINWYTEMLMSGDAGKINNTQRDYLKEVYIGSKRMVDLVNALLNVSRIELGTFAVEPEPVKVIEIAQSVLDELIPSIKEKNIKIVKKFNKKLPVIQADAKLLRIVFQNLLSNAIKYTPKNGSVIIEIKKDKEFILCKIKDTGMGIPKSQQKNIFTKLFRADNVRATDTEGTGLGLYIVRAIVEHSGGKIWFKSKEGVGTTFNVKIPLKGMAKREGAKELSSS
jgi:PAS domain S-box-containing protein